MHYTHWMGGGGMFTRNGSNSLGTGTTLQYKDFLVPCRLLTEVLGLSMHPNDTHPFIKLNHEPNQLPGGSTLLCRGEDPYPTHTSPCLMILLQIFVLLTHYLYICLTIVSLVTSFDASAHKIKNPTALVVQ